MPLKVQYNDLRINCLTTHRFESRLQIARRVFPAVDVHSSFVTQIFSNGRPSRTILFAPPFPKRAYAKHEMFLIFQALVVTAARLGTETSVKIRESV